MTRYEELGKRLSEFYDKLEDLWVSASYLEKDLQDNWVNVEYKKNPFRGVDFGDKDDLMGIKLNCEDLKGYLLRFMGEGLEVLNDLSFSLNDLEGDVVEGLDSLGFHDRFREGIY